MSDQVDPQTREENDRRRLLEAYRLVFADMAKTHDSATYHARALVHDRIKQLEYAE